MDVRKTYKLYVGGEFVRSESGRVQRTGGVNVPRGSRKDLRDAVKSARQAFGGWSRRTAMNRGQVLYRAAEMMDSRRSQLSVLLGGGRPARRELEACVDAWVWFAGWTDKLAQVVGTVNPVAGPYFNFTVPEPTGVVGIVAPDQPALLPLVRRLGAALCGGNTCLAIVSESNPLPALVLGEVLETSDLPPGAVNLLSGQRRELVPWLAAHMDVNAVDGGGCSPEELKAVEETAAINVKRVVHAGLGDGLSPQAIAAFMELKTVWHPVGP